MAVAQPDETSAGEPVFANVEAVFAALESPVLSYAQRLVGDIGVAEDVVQEAFMKLHAQFSEVREPRRWLYRTVHNLALNHLRKANRIVPLATSESEGGASETQDPDPLPDEQIARMEGIGLVRLTLENLDVRSRELVRLRFHEGLSYKEMSERTGITIGHVGYLLHHALKTVAAELAKSGIVP
jgi:RNA polymerase sigma-70 factor (ECF subfamily)